MGDGTTDPSISQLPSIAEEPSDDLEKLEEEMESENEGLDTKNLLKIVLFIVVATILLMIILGVFGYLAQSEYGSP
jgi:hypothetical protein